MLVQCVYQSMALDVAGTGQMVIPWGNLGSQAEIFGVGACSNQSTSEVVHLYALRRAFGS